MHLLRILRRALVKAGGKARRDGTWLSRLGQYPNHDDPGSARCEHLIEVALVDASDGEPRPTRIQARRVANQV